MYLNCKQFQKGFQRLQSEFLENKLLLFQIHLAKKQLFNGRTTMNRFIKFSPIIISTQILKSSRNKKDLNDVTAAPFLVSFSQLPFPSKNPKTTFIVVFHYFRLKKRTQYFWIPVIVECQKNCSLSPNCIF